MKCDYCTEKCPQSETIREIAKGRMYATNEVVKLQKQLDEYKSLEEQGLLLRLPCKVGDIIYQIWYVDDKPEIAEMKIATLNNLVALMEYGDFGKTVFLTQSEAEQKLKEMESD